MSESSEPDWETIDAANVSDMIARGVLVPITKLVAQLESRVKELELTTCRQTRRKRCMRAYLRGGGGGPL